MSLLDDISYDKKLFQPLVIEKQKSFFEVDFDRPALNYIY
jgi:hypothetical protein